MRNDTPEQLRGVVEVDETFLKAHLQAPRASRHDNSHHALVVGAVERGGQVRLAVKRNRSRYDLHGFINEAVHDETEAIYTDEFASYQGIADENTRHETVNHSANEWVSADVHTQTIESVWSLLKRSVVGSFHKISMKHLPAYLDEVAYKYNNRENKFMFRDTLLELIGAEQLSYKELVRPRQHVA